VLATITPLDIRGIGSIMGLFGHIWLFSNIKLEERPIRTSHKINLQKLSNCLSAEFFYKKSFYCMKSKQCWALIAVFLVVFGLSVMTQFNINVPRDKILLVGSSEIQILKGSTGGPEMQSSSIVFLSGVRNVTYEAYGPYASYGEGPTEPSLASVSGNSLLKQSSPLTIASSDNTRGGILKYTVKPGDIPSVIAASFGITTNSLLWANNLSDGQFIKPGDELIILPVSGVLYKVRSGDTVSSIASRFKGDVGRIIAFNGLSSSGVIVEGEQIIIPDGEKTTGSYGSSYTTIYSTYTKDLDGYFIHPTAGIGYKSRGLHPHNAVDIAAFCWAPIYAAAEGTVSISDGYGWNGGYGKYVKIDHPNGTKTIYSHNIQNQVSWGQYVEQGQLIAYMGSTGRSTGCHVHWEVYGALNPLR